MVNMFKFNIKKNFGKRLKSIRLEKGLTQERLAELMGLQATSISYIENGKNFLSFTKLQKLCEVLDIEPIQLFIVDKRDEQNLDIKKELCEIINTLDNKRLKFLYKIVLETGKL